MGLGWLTDGCRGSLRKKSNLLVGVAPFLHAGWIQSKGSCIHWLAYLSHRHSPATVGLHNSPPRERKMNQPQGEIWLLQMGQDSRPVPCRSLVSLELGLCLELEPSDS